MHPGPWAYGPKTNVIAFCLFNVTHYLHRVGTHTLYLSSYQVLCALFLYTIVGFSLKIHFSIVVAKNIVADELIVKLCD